MKFPYLLTFLLLFAQNIPSSDCSGCSLNESIGLCSCSLLDLENIFSILPCIEATSFEFSGGSYLNTENVNLESVQLDLFLNQLRLPFIKVSLINAVVSEELLFTFIYWIRKIPINLLALENTTCVGYFNGTSMNVQPPYISSLEFINVSSHPLMPGDNAFNGFGNWRSTMGKITVMKSNLKDIPCSISTKFGSLFNLDLSENLLQDANLSSSFCRGAFPLLRILKLRQNNLVNYETVCQTLGKYDQLMQLDLSQNKFSRLSDFLCKWPPSLINLNLSDTGLEDVKGGLPENCEVLDLSHNRIEFLNISLGRLKKLYLSYNRIATFSSLGSFPMLQVLAIDGNRISTLQKDELQLFKNLKTLKGDNNPYICTCSFVSEMKESSQNDWTFQQWPEGYACSSPDSFRDMLVENVSRSFFDCHTELLIILICIIILLLTVAIIICFIKIHRSNKTRSQSSVSGNSNSVQFQQ
ncbi:monocyte differentiation antigen CD14 [Hyperolius riggenbachi]|uniref:monocyte differentiation antigen CD14 n=1 Tax=Hyperolius riggenbachi TaxID=752182 RepID=UPI0035A2C3FB